jgi:hypothetical protein
MIPPFTYKTQFRFDSSTPLETNIYFKDKTSKINEVRGIQIA